MKRKQNCVFSALSRITDSQRFLSFSHSCFYYVSSVGFLDHWRESEQFFKSIFFLSSAHTLENESVKIHFPKHFSQCSTIHVSFTISDVILFELDQHTQTNENTPKHWKWRRIPKILVRIQVRQIKRNEKPWDPIFSFVFVPWNSLVHGLECLAAHMKHFQRRCSSNSCDALGKYKKQQIRMDSFFLCSF